MRSNCVSVTFNACGIGRFAKGFQSHFVFDEKCIEEREEEIRRKENTMFKSGGAQN